MSKVSPSACRTYISESFIIFMLANVLCTYIYEFNEDIAALEMFYPSVLSLYPLL
jgi:hypothetical protein